MISDRRDDMTLAELVEELELLSGLRLRDGSPRPTGALQASSAPNNNRREVGHSSGDGGATCKWRH